ncbi:hypothetical protein [Streptomyces sp. NPDC046685]|uniref:hypothetical protein n=1 Tax=Streptomyces sp. NPDC046685 TaxID=3157202 RepID=UPI0033D42FBF
MANNPPRNATDVGYANAARCTRWNLARTEDRSVFAMYVDRHGRWVVRVLAGCPHPPPPWSPLPVPCPENRF